MMKTKFRTLVSTLRNGNVSFSFLRNLPLERLGAFCVSFVLLFSISLQAQETLHGDNFFVSNGAQIHCVNINSAGEQSTITITEHNQRNVWEEKVETNNHEFSSEKSKNSEKKVVTKSSQKKYLTKKNHPSDKKLINALNPDAQNFWITSAGIVREISAPQVLQIAIAFNEVYYSKHITRNLLLDSIYQFAYYSKLYSYSGFSRPPPSFLA